jgi:hypothetical protein
MMRFIARLLLLAAAPTLASDIPVVAVPPLRQQPGIARAAKIHGVRSWRGCLPCTASTCLQTRLGLPSPKSG